LRQKSQPAISAKKFSFPASVKPKKMHSKKPTVDQGNLSIFYPEFNRDSMDGGIIGELSALLNDADTTAKEVHTRSFRKTAAVGPRINNNSILGDPQLEVVINSGLNTAGRSSRQKSKKPTSTIKNIKKSLKTSQKERNSSGSGAPGNRKLSQNAKRNLNLLKQTSAPVTQIQQKLGKTTSNLIEMQLQKQRMSEKSKWLE